MIALDLLRERVADMKTCPEAASDVGFALQRLRERDDYHGRAGTIKDLQDKVSATSEAHDPEVIQQLTDSLNAFLDEEMDEAMKVEEERMNPEKQPTYEGGPETVPGQAQPGVVPGAPPGAPQAAPPGAPQAAPPGAPPGAPQAAPQPGADPAAEPRRQAAEADGYMRYSEMGAGGGGMPYTEMAAPSDSAQKKEPFGQGPPPGAGPQGAAPQGIAPQGAGGGVEKGKPQFGDGGMQGSGVGAGGPEQKAGTAPPPQGGGEDQHGEGDDEHLLERRQAAQSDNFMKYEDNATNGEETPMQTCEACGSPLADGGTMNESAAPEATVREGAESTAVLRESAQEELVRLRAADRANQTNARATAAIAAVEATGLVLEDELTPFSEAQWPVLLDRWVSGTRSYNGGERATPAPPMRESHRKGTSAADVFKESFGS